jgi:hypothetical protein
LTTDRIELGVANVRRKLTASGLDGFVGERLDSDVGNFHFVCTDVDALIAHVREMGWELEGDRAARWHLREPVARLSLHIKHFDGWPPDRLQAHIDPYGVVGPLTWILHALTPRGYRNVERIRSRLTR